MAKERAKHCFDLPRLVHLVMMDRYSPSLAFALAFASALAMPVTIGQFIGPNSRPSAKGSYIMIELEKCDGAESWLAPNAQWDSFRCKLAHQV